MARAFIASVPLGIVLVAALVVPLLVTPGTFGFRAWPTAAHDVVTDRPVIASEPVAAAVSKAAADAPDRSRQAPAAHLTFASAKPGSGRTRAAVATRHVAVPHRRRAAGVIAHPHPQRPQHQAPNRTPAMHHVPTPAAPATPSVPSSQPEPAAQPAPVPQQVATAPAPVARNDPPPTPPPAPVQVIVPAPPPGNADEHDDGDGHHGHGHGLALGHLLEHGHGHGHGDD